MLRQQTEEEKRITAALDSTEGSRFMVQAVDISAQIRLLDSVLKSEYRSMARWRYPLILLASRNAVYDAGFLYLIGRFLARVPGHLIPVFAITPSVRWIRGVHILIDLSRYVAAEESVPSLLGIARQESLYFLLERPAFAPRLYERLALLLSRLTEFTPDSKEHHLLQQMVLNPKRYPDSLRIAALLTLGDHPKRLNQRFRKKLEALIIEEPNEAFRAAAQDVLSRK
ncbi:MAG: hypothetical protein QM758_03100 [Armatimonas sp.]